MPTDPKTQPLAALVKKWRTEARSFRDTARNAAARNRNETWEECDAKARLLVKHAEELESALLAQRNVWQDRLLTRGGDEYSCGEIDALGACIGDLKVDK